MKKKWIFSLWDNKTIKRKIVPEAHLLSKNFIKKNMQSTSTLYSMKQAFCNQNFFSKKPLSHTLCLCQLKKPHKLIWFSHKITKTLLNSALFPQPSPHTEKKRRNIKKINSYTRRILNMKPHTSKNRWKKYATILYPNQNWQV